MVTYNVKKRGIPPPQQSGSADNQSHTSSASTCAQIDQYLH